MNLFFLKEEREMVNEKMFYFINNMEMKIRTPMRYYFIPQRLKCITKNKISQCWYGIGTLINCWWESRLSQPFDKIAYV